MSRTLIVIAAFLTLSLPAALAAPPEGKGKPENAAKACKAERAAMGVAAFKAKYKSNGLGKCIAEQKQKTKKDKAKEDEEDEAGQTAAEENAAKKCKAEREQLGLEEFRKKYAPPGHPTGANAFGKCVSKLAKATTG
jgi:hypothetical protein